MTINITGRKTTIKDSFREEAEREMTRFDRLFDDDASAHITVSNEGGRETVEITIRSGGMIFRAEKPPKTASSRWLRPETCCSVRS